MTVNNISLTEPGRAVCAVLDEVYAAWAEGDADAFVAPYAKTATAVLPGMYLPDREAIRSTMAALLTGELKGSKAVHEVQSIRFVDADVAIVISKGAVLLADQTEPDAANHALETWVLSRQDSLWRVQAFHNCPQHTA
ncbi:SgcJ/EcaC family oxidoreductase [Nonomuraea sp. NPDC049784]|uniref:SgcJ/EcaC family oxidoreductase n=1 Tax=Nonomuraea sp. NPDC049784 TaxID=3154361 RepID=UPI003411C0D4